MKSLFENIQFVFLDRDGVINRKAPEGKYVSSREEFHLLPGVASAISTLNRTGRRVIVISNQRGVALGLYTAADVDALHSWVREYLAGHGARIDGFYYCPHDKNQCDCRKPKTGLFEQAQRDFPEACPANSLIIGDSVSDIEAGRNFGCRTIFIEGDAQTQKPGSEKALALADAYSASLERAVEDYLS